VNDSLISGMVIVDCLLPIGKGQRQLILGDRYTGKTSLFMNIILSSSNINQLASIDGLGTKRLFGIYIGLNVSLNKLSKLIQQINNYNCN
jgi:F-type H+-transporting ATPase subunit alpha